MPAHSEDDAADGSRSCTAELSPTSEHAETSGSKPATTALRVLVVDDDAMVRQVLEAYLMRRGHVTKVVGTRAEALRAVQAEPFDVVVTDVLLPDGDGIDLINRMAALPFKGRIIAVTGGGRYFGPEFFRRVANALGAMVLQKPFGAEAFLNAVEGAAPAKAPLLSC